MSVIAAALPFISAGATVLSVFSGLSAGESQARATEDAARQNARAIEDDRRANEESRVDEVEQLRRRGRQNSSAARAAAAAAGFDVNSGSSLLEQEDALAQIQADIDAVNRNAFNRDRSLATSRGITEAQGRAQSTQIRRDAAGRAGSSLLTGAIRFGQSGALSSPKRIPGGDPI